MRLQLRLALFPERGAQDGLENVCLANETQVVRMRTVGRAFAVIAQQIVSTNIIQSGHALLLEFFETLTQGGVIVRVKLMKRGENPRVGVTSIFDEHDGGGRMGRAQLSDQRRA